MSDFRDCDCPKRDPYLCVAHSFAIRGFNTQKDADGEDYCTCDCHSDWWIDDDDRPERIND